MAFEFAYREGGSGNAPVRVFPSGAGKTFKKGEPLNLESGRLDNGAPADTAIVGIANASYNAVAQDTAVEVIEALPDVVFMVDVYTGGAKTSFTNADIGTAFDLYAADNGKIDPNDITGGMCVLQKFNNNYKLPNGSTIVKAWVKILPASRASVVA